MRYENFDLHIRKEGDLYVAQVTDSPVGESEREVLRWPFDDAEQQLRVLAKAIEDSCLAGTRSNTFVSYEESILRQFGAAIFRSVFVDSKSVADSYRSSLDHVGRKEDTGLRVNLRIEPPEMAVLPWEYVCDGTRKQHEYLCLRSTTQVSPIVRDLGQRRAGHAVAPDGPVRVLGMIANTGGGHVGLDTERERRQLVEVLGDSVTWVPRATQDALFEAMQDGPWHIFHFIGHGGTNESVVDGKVVSEGFLVMEDGRGGTVEVSANRLGEILEEGKIELAVLNCCDSARGGASSSVGAALVASTVPMSIAMQFKITDASASRFSEQFYKSLREGHTVETALTKARKKIRFGSDAEWAIPVFFTRVDSCVLFKEQDPIPAARGPAEVAPAPAAAQPLPAAVTLAQQQMRELWGNP